MKNKLKAYFWEECEDSESGVCVVAKSVKEAKKIARKYWEKEFGCESDFIEQRCHLQKTDYDITGLPNGYVFEDLKEGIKRGVYGFGSDDCEICGNFTEYATYDKKRDKIVCSRCSGETDEKSNT